MAFLNRSRGEPGMTNGASSRNRAAHIRDLRKRPAKVIFRSRPFCWFPGQGRDDSFRSRGEPGMTLRGGIGALGPRKCEVLYPTRRPGIAKRISGILGNIQQWLFRNLSLFEKVPESRSAYPGSYEHQEVVVFRARPFRLGPGTSPG